jgi:geranylgeranyl diphosphate synthase type II
MDYTPYITVINEYLDRILPKEDTPPVPIYQAMRYSVFAGGKRLRPILCLLAGEALDGDPKQLCPIAASIEMIHTYSLIHDDLPCMDDDDFRRGKPTNHKVFGEAIAVLAGDALLTFALESLMLAPYQEAIRCRLTSVLTNAAGPHGMIGGQVLDILSEAKQLTRVELERVHGMKTAALIGFSAMAPAIVLQAGGDVEQIFKHFGETIGLAFQIVDDVLDIEGKTEMLGKTAGKDADKEKATYPSLIGLQESKRLAADLVQSATTAIASYDRNGQLAQFATYILERKM